MSTTLYLSWCLATIFALASKLGTELLSRACQKIRVMCQKHVGSVRNTWQVSKTRGKCQKECDTCQKACETCQKARKYEVSFRK